jgi:hypothetical protein
MANFALDGGTPQGEILSSLNYVLSNLGQGTNANVLVANTNTGQITNSTSGEVLAYIYQFICVRYSDSPNGTLYASPTNRSYFGILNNSTGTFSTNPADYQWTQVTGGFSTTKYLWYASLGGRQIQWFAGTTPPASNYNQVIDSTAINLDIITGAASNQLIDQPVYLRANTQPATPTGGNFNFTTLTLYPPTGWSTTPPTNANVYVYISSAIFSGNAGNVAPSTAWSYPVVLASNFAGNTGPQGSRGPIPLGYVITDSDPTFWIDTQYSTAFQAPRANVVAPIGVSPFDQVYTPIPGDTAQFFYPNLAYPNNQVTLVKSFSSNTSPNWQSVLANVVSGNVIYTGSITSSALNTNDIYAINISGGGGAVGDIYTNGYWLQANTGSAAFGGNLYIGDNLKAGVNAVIGANLNVGINAIIGGNLTVGNNAVIGGNATVAGVITTGALNANIVTTNSLVVNSATQTINATDNTNYPTINFVNGTTNTPTTAGFLWPFSTRGFAIGGGATITTTTNGSVSGSKIMVNYNAYINSLTNTQSGLVELWRSGGSDFYRNTFQIVRSIVDPTSNAEAFTAPGDNGALYIGNATTFTQYITSTTNTLYDASSTLGASWVWGQNGQVNFFSGTTEFFNGNVAGAITSYSGSGSSQPLFTILAAEQFQTLSGPNTYLPTILAGADGRIARWTGRAIPYSSGYYAAETSGVFADLNDITSNYNNYSYYKSTPASVSYVVVGTGGTILYNTRSYDSVGNTSSSTGWTQADSNTIQNLNGVQSNAGLTTQANAYVAVGRGGTILYSASVSGPWIAANSVPTTVNLNAVGWTNNNWVAVGDAGTIITSTDGSNWTGPIANPADGVTVPANGVRNLIGVAGGLVTNKFVTAGQEIIMTSNTTSPTGGWNSTAYLGGSSVTSTLTRLQYQGSYANVANVSSPPPAQQQVTNGQVVSGTYTDIDYTSGQDITYYLVLGNMVANTTIFTNGPSMSVTEFKR